MGNMLVGLGPVVNSMTRVVILGSMPGGESLQRGEYYAHGRNRFWPVMEELFGIPRGAPYGARLRLLNEAGLGLWDVIASCDRRGSLDSDIVTSTEIYNDFNLLLSSHVGISRMCANGGKAYDAFIKRIIPGLDPGLAARFDLVRLPSTSPANAAFSLTDIVKAWSRALGDVVPHRNS